MTDLVVSDTQVATNSENTIAGDSRQRERITLKPVNPDLEPMVLTWSNEGEMQVVADIVEVLRSEA